MSAYAESYEENKYLYYSSIVENKTSESLSRSVFIATINSLSCRRCWPSQELFSRPLKWIKTGICKKNKTCVVGLEWFP